ncbi:MAG: cation transporting ATPase C-terminal domain-containing protein [Nitrospirota bacterium]|nr:cation transporting ATPase C-terminal domain-containing protein [Nitrospirota bacterium]
MTSIPSASTKPYLSRFARFPCTWTTFSASLRKSPRGDERADAPKRDPAPDSPSLSGGKVELFNRKKRLLSTGPSSNLWLLGAVLLTFVLQMSTIYVPFLNPIFYTIPLTLNRLGLFLLLSTNTSF